MAHGTISDSHELAYYLCLAPRRETLRRLDKVAGDRFTITECVVEAKGEDRLDHYQERHWQSWYRHITLALMALASLGFATDFAGRL